MVERNRGRMARSAGVRLLAAIILGFSLISAACSSDDDAAPVESTTTEEPSETTEEPRETTTSEAPTTSPTTESSSTTDVSTTGDNGSLPGEEFVGFFEEGDVVAVMGVAYDDVLNVREAPGTDQEIVATAEPTADDLVATGRARILPNSIWYEVTLDGTTGWVSAAFVAYVGLTDDATAGYLDGGDPPTAPTLAELGQLVAEDFASVEPPSRIVQSVAPVTGDLGEVTYDVIGLGDDAVIGFRLHIFALEDPDSEMFQLRTIERTVFCGRGLSGELCT